MTTLGAFTLLLERAKGEDEDQTLVPRQEELWQKHQEENDDDKQQRQWQNMISTGTAVPRTWKWVGVF
jgi:hypothetical protein